MQILSYQLKTKKIMGDAIVVSLWRHLLLIKYA